MTSPTTLVCLLAALLLPLAVLGAVHRVDVVQQRSSSDRAGLNAADSSHLLHQMLKQHGIPAPDPQADRRAHQQATQGGVKPMMAAVVSQGVDGRDYGYTWMGNFSLGTPAQSFGLEFDLSAPNLYVIDVNGQYYDSWARSSSAYTDVTDKQTYDPTASTSYASVNADFSTLWAYENGSVASDTLTMGSLQVTVSFEDATTVNKYVSYYANDGTFGLSTSADANASSTLLAQLQPSLDSPVVTFNFLSTNTDSSVPGTGQITFGGLAPDTCQSDWTQVMNTSSWGGDYGFPVFNIASVSTANPANANCDYHNVDGNVMIFMGTSFGNMYTSYQVQEVFLVASNATFNWTTWQYELTPDQVANAQPVYLNLVDGGSLRVDPDDYIAYYSGGSYLNIYGHYDARKYGLNYISLNMNFINNHCLSKNFGSSYGAIWSIANTVKDTEQTDPPATPPSSSGGSGGN